MIPNSRASQTRDREGCLFCPEGTSGDPICELSSSRQLADRNPAGFVSLHPCPYLPRSPGHPHRHTEGLLTRIDPGSFHLLHKCHVQSETQRPPEAQLLGPAK